MKIVFFSVFFCFAADFEKEFEPFKKKINNISGEVILGPSDKTTFKKLSKGQASLDIFEFSGEEFLNSPYRNLDVDNYVNPEDKVFISESSFIIPFMPPKFFEKKNFTEEDIFGTVMSGVKVLNRIDGDSLRVKKEIKLGGFPLPGLSVDASLKYKGYCAEDSNPFKTFARTSSFSSPISLLGGNIFDVEKFSNGGISLYDFFPLYEHTLVRFYQMQTVSAEDFPWPASLGVSYWTRKFGEKNHKKQVRKLRSYFLMNKIQE